MQKKNKLLNKLLMSTALTLTTISKVLATEIVIDMTEVDFQQELDNSPNNELVIENAPSPGPTDLNISSGRHIDGFEYDIINNIQGKNIRFLVQGTESAQYSIGQFISGRKTDFLVQGANKNIVEIDDFNNADADTGFKAIQASGDFALKINSELEIDSIALTNGTNLTIANNSAVQNHTYDATSKIILDNQDLDNPTVHQGTLDGLGTVETSGEGLILNSTNVGEPVIKQGKFLVGAKETTVNGIIGRALDNGDAETPVEIQFTEGDKKTLILANEVAVTKSNGDKIVGADIDFNNTGSELVLTNHEGASHDTLLGTIKNADGAKIYNQFGNLWLGDIDTAQNFTINSATSSLVIGNIGNATEANIQNETGTITTGAIANANGVVIGTDSGAINLGDITDGENFGVRSTTGNITLGKIDNANGARIITGGDVTLGVVKGGTEGESEAFVSGNNVTLADGSEFSIIEAQKLQGAGTINARNIEAGEIAVTENLTLTRLAKADGSNYKNKFITSDLINIGDEKGLTINIPAYDILDTFEANIVTASTNSTLTLNGNFHIRSHNIGSEAQPLGTFNVAQAEGSIARFSSAGEDITKHYIDNISGAEGEIQIVGSYTNNGGMTVKNLDLTYQPEEGTERVGSKLTLTNKLALKEGGKITIGNGSVIEVDAFEYSAPLKISPLANFHGDDSKKPTLSGIALKEFTDIVPDYSYPSPIFAASLIYQDQDGNEVPTTGNPEMVESISVSVSIDQKKVNDYFTGVTFPEEFNSIKTNASTVTGSAKDFLIDSVAFEDKTDVTTAPAKERSIAYLNSALPRNVANPVMHLNHVNEIALGAVNSAINSRIASGASDDLGVEAGFWLKGVYGKAWQKEGAEASKEAYDATIKGAILGLDVTLGESSTIGIAGSYTVSDLSYTGIRKDKDTFDSMFLSLYGYTEFSNNIVLKGVLSAGQSNINGDNYNSVTERSIKSKQIASNAFVGHVLGGYKLDLGMVSVTPHLGAGFGYYNNPSRDTSFEGYSKAKEWSTKRFDGIAGLTIAGEGNFDDLTLVPEIHGFGYYNFNGDKSTVSIDMQGLPAGNSLTYLATDTARANFTVGGSVTAKTGMVDLTFSVDGQFAEKYSGVIGALKLKVNF